LKEKELSESEEDGEIESEKESEPLAEEEDDRNEFDELRKLKG